MSLSNPGYRNSAYRLFRLPLVCARPKVVASIIFGLVVLVGSAARATDEVELEKAAREVAIESVSTSVRASRWPPSRFPIQIGIGARGDLKRCLSSWEGRVRDYVRFVNATGPSLAEARTDSSVAAYVFVGTRDEYAKTRAYQLEDRWLQKTDSIRYSLNHRADLSYVGAYGLHQSVEFAVNFVDRPPRSLGQYTCLTIDPADEFGLVLLQDYAFAARGFIDVQYGEKADPTLAWRVHRRLLSAMKKLPESQLDAEQVQALLIAALTTDQ
jgi:hypothetical protein